MDKFDDLSIKQSKLKSHQEQAVSAAYKSIASGKKRISMHIAAGAGKTAICLSLTKFLIDNKILKNIIILSSRFILAEQIAETAAKVIPGKVCTRIKNYGNTGIVITTYQDLIQNISNENLDSIELIICDNIEYITDDILQNFLNKSTAVVMAITSKDLQQQETDHWLENYESVYKYTAMDAVKDGYLNPYRENHITEKIVSELFAELGYKNIEFEKQYKADGYSIRPDMIIRDEKELILIETKSSRGINITNSIVSNAAGQILNYRHILQKYERGTDITPLLIMLCEVPEEIKHSYFEQSNITIWDVNNVAFMCGSNAKLLQTLYRALPFASDNLKPKKPIGWYPNKKANPANEAENTADILNQIKTFEEQLQKCKPGNIDNSAYTYEKICTDIIKFLFGAEFSKISYQHKTDDKLFRMDLLCALKGSSEFWRFLIKYYNTKFVVFEFKNHTDPVTQNMIYITEKYLYRAVLRNVAIIVSRKGFDTNAKRSAIACLAEDGKLILDINDDDLISMLRLKADGTEPSDYLLSKAEDFLMSVGK